LPGIEERNIEVILDRDAFTVGYDSTMVTLEDMYRVIIEIGYSPGLVSPEVSDPQANKEVMSSPIDPALTRASKEGKLVLLDFSAEWCAACKVLESRVLSDDSVTNALKNYVFVSVDTDTYPEATSAYNVVGMPTLVIVNLDGEELFRNVGLIDPKELSQKLDELAAK